MAKPAENLPATSDANKLAPITRNETVNAVMRKVSELQQRGQLQFPRDYSVQNALMSAYLILQQTKDKADKPVLTACSRESIANALLDTVVQGLNPAKKQCYYIAYGSQLVCQRSYFGTMAVAKRVTGCQDIFAEVVYEGDEFEYEIKFGRKNIIKHIQKMGNVARDKIRAAYCVIVKADGSTHTEIMTFDQIKQAWMKSQNRPLDEKGNLKPGSTHGQFPEEMAKKTVINRACKAFINSSDDSSLDVVRQAFNRSDDIIEEAEFQQELEQNANTEVLDLPAGDTPDEQQGTAEQAEPAKPEPPRQQRLDQQPKATSRGPGF